MSDPGKAASAKANAAAKAAAKKDRATPGWGDELAHDLKTYRGQRQAANRGPSGRAGDIGGRTSTRMSPHAPKAAKALKGGPVKAVKRRGRRKLNRWLSSS